MGLQLLYNFSFSIDTEKVALNKTFISGIV